MGVDSLPLVFRGSDAVACGALTRAQLRGPAVRRLRQGIYTTWRGRLTHELRCRAEALALPADAVITGRSAATVLGVRLCWPEDDVTVIAPPETRLGHRTGLDVRRTMIAAAEWRPWADGKLATSERMALDLLLGRPLPEAVADLDAVLRAGLVDRATLSALVGRRSDNGIVLARQAVSMANPEAAESLPESILRVHLELAGLTPVPQYWLEDRHGRIARVDLAFPERKVAVEYDGDWRDGQSWALNRDRARLNRVQAIDWDVVFVTAPLLRDVRRLLRTVESALSRDT